MQILEKPHVQMCRFSRLLAVRLNEYMQCSILMLRT
jgi:hypothetical protein